ncbi:primosomal protein N' [Marinitoga sp. 1138]|uniref:replication restart helicase PriA n=1 Tax=Marinitoga sp. 1138 TaxID=1643334 RepID=UPI001586AF41|nr:primosomal protein N' [Marinitoga sp. 1138]NUU97337.1 hypothetical protein [Marinitoga sp. 1138]
MYHYYEIAVFGTYTYNTYTYKSTNQLTPGQRVLVDFRNQQKIGVILSETSEKPYNVKEIELLLDEKPLISQKHIELIKEASIKFLMPISEIAKIVFPPISSDRTRIKIIPKSPLAPIEKPIFINEFYKKFKTKKEANKKLKQLLENHIVSLELYYKRKIEKKDRYISLKLDLNQLLEQKVSQAGMNIINFLQENNGCVIEKELYQNNIIKPGSTALKTLIKKGIISYTDYKKETPFKVSLTEKQKEILEKILYSNKNIELLYGVTGSGKTEIFFEAMESYFKNEKKVMILLPEISLTPQLISRINNRFPDKKIGVYHSGISPAEKIKTWYEAVNGEIDILVGARSAVWIPLKNLGLVIADEEHDQSFYQFDQLSYDAIEVIYLRSKIEDIKVILSSATPTIREMKNAFEGKINLHKLQERVFTQMPDIEIIDIKKEEKVSWIFTKKVIKEISKTLSNNKKVLIFSPTKGYANYLICTNCGEIIKCKHCDISLTYHKHTKKLKCHYCGYEINVPPVCPKCGSPTLQSRGYGTERVVNEILRFFPSRKVVRIDREIIKTHEDLENAFNEIKKEEPMIIVGTKMITKGLDISDIKLVIVLDSDRYLSFPEYTSFEHTASLLIQVAGRSGRREKGKVIIQTFKSGEDFFDAVKNHDYDKIIDLELSNRKKFNYPPFSQLIIFLFSNEDKNKAYKEAFDFYEEINDLFDNSIEILEPTEPLIPKLRGLYRYQVIIKDNINDQEKLMEIIKEYGKKCYIYVNPPTTLL